jgi:peroxiredoxin family protein
VSKLKIQKTNQEAIMPAKKLAIIATKGTLDWAYPPFILASTAAALGYDTQIFFTFYGLQLLKKDLDLSVSPLGNPGMPMPMSMDKWFPVMGTAIPGMQAIMTKMMKNKMKSKGVASVADLRDLCIEAEVKLIACQMTVDLFDMKPTDFIEDIDYAGAATFFEFAGESDVNLYI